MCQTLNEKRTQWTSRPPSRCRPPRGATSSSFRWHGPGRRPSARRSAQQRLQTLPCDALRSGHPDRSGQAACLLRSRSRIKVGGGRNQDRISAEAVQRAKQPHGSGHHPQHHRLLCCADLSVAPRRPDFPIRIQPRRIHGALPRRSARPLRRNPDHEGRQADPPRSGHHPRGRMPRRHFIRRRRASSGAKSRATSSIMLRSIGPSGSVSTNRPCSFTTRKGPTARCLLDVTKDYAAVYEAEAKARAG